jgi:hypothetical protein
MNGSFVLAFYQGTQQLDSAMRSDMLDCIIQEFYNKSHSMGNDEFKVVAAKIVKLFKTESFESYYRPPENKQPSKGKLCDKYRNFNGKLRKIKSKLCSTDVCM